MRRICAIAVGMAVAGAACAAQFEGAELAPGNVNAKDLTKLAKVEKVAEPPIVVVDREGAARMTIVRADDRAADWAAKQLRATIEEMTGVKLAIIVERAGKPVPNAPAFYVGAVSAAEKAGLKAPTDKPAAFSVVTKDGSVYFLGRSDYAVTDWCERELGARYYWPEVLGGGKNAKTVHGKCVVKTKGLAVHPCAWTDSPVFGARDNWPYEGQDWNRWAKGGTEHRGGVNVHAPHGWWKETNALDHVEIFALNVDGKRPTSPLLCYGNPKSLAYYEMRTAEGIKAWNDYQAAKEAAAPKDKGKVKFKDPAGGILNYAKKVVTISQWDCGVNCACNYCSKLYDEKLGWTFHNHDYVGMRMVLPIMRRLKLPLGAEKNYVEKLVGMHMRPIHLADEGITDSAIRRVMFEAGEDTDDLMTLCEADITSKIPEKVKRFLENFKIVRQKMVEIQEKDDYRNWTPPIDGNEIMERYHLSPSREVGLLREAQKDAILLPHKIQTRRILTDVQGIDGSVLEGRDYYDAFVLGARANGVVVDHATGTLVKNATPTQSSGTFACTTAGVTFKYTADGSDPRYSATAKVAVSESEASGTVIKVCAVKAGNIHSDVLTYTA